MLANAEAIAGHIFQTETEPNAENNYQSDRLETETYGLLLPAGFTVAEQAKYGGENSKEKRPEKEEIITYDLKGYKQKKRRWYHFWSCFSDGLRNRRKILGRDG